MSAWTEARDRAREKAKADPSLIPHGTASGHGYWGCRCRECNEAARLDDAAARARAKARAGKPLSDFDRRMLADRERKAAGA